MWMGWIFRRTHDGWHEFVNINTAIRAEYNPNQNQLILGTLSFLGNDALDIYFMLCEDVARRDTLLDKAKGQ